MDPTVLLAQLYSYVLPAFPAQWAAGITVIVAWIVATCSAIIYFWAKKPPVKGDKLYGLYVILSKIGAYGNHTPTATVKEEKK